MSDVHALLVTDVVDSTAVASRIGDAAMASLWQSHDRQARDLLARWRGREIDRSDGFLLLFDTAADALGCALDYHRLLRSLPGEPRLAARAGIHVGPLTLRSNPADDVARGAKPLEVEGLSKAVAARVMSVARGGQTLLTAAANEALGAPTTLRIRSHGWWRLKGLPEPLELFEAGESDGLFEPPADSDKVHRVVRDGERWLPAREIGHSLPPEPDAFVGRDDALRSLGRLFDDGARLISLHGMGGAGKTRLALHYGWRWLGEFAAGVWFCDLSAARDLGGVVRAVAQGLRVPLGRADAVSQLGQAIAGRGPCLVILDNFEQVTALAPATLGVWMLRAPQARFLVTSREVLRLAGEEVLELRPMNHGEGSALFRRRAAAAGAPPPSDDDSADLVQLIDLLDGLPLAIELAAARAPLMPPRELLQRMGERFKLLAGTRGRPDHQATLRATLDWSWQMLSLSERDALAQLSVFEGGAALAAIEATVGGGARDDALPLVDVLQSLVEKSLVRRVAENRLDLLATVREYAAGCLATPGCFPGSGTEALTHARSRHWRWFAAQAPEEALRDGCADLGNWVAATRHATAAGDAAAACAALEGSWEALQLRGPFALGIELAKQVALLPLDALQRSRVDRIAGWALRVSGRVAEARQRFDAALDGVLALPDPVQEARVRAQLALLHLNLGSFEPARGELLRSLSIAQRSGDRPLECEALTGLGDLAVQQGQPELAAERFTKVLELARRAGYRRWEGGALGNLGLVRDEQGRSEEARSLYEAALVVARGLGDRQWEGNNLCNLGLLLHLQGDLAGARRALEAALTTARELGHARLECIASINAARAAGALGDDSAAEALFDRALRLAIELEDRRSQGQVRGGLGALFARRGRFDAARESVDLGAALLAQGTDPLNQGLLLCDRAEFEHFAGDTIAARASVAQARSLAASIDSGGNSELGHRLLAIERLLRP